MVGREEWINSSSAGDYVAGDTLMLQKESLVGVAQESAYDFVSAIKDLADRGQSLSNDVVQLLTTDCVL